MYSLPAPPAFGELRSPTPTIIFLMLPMLTPAEVNWLSGILHSCQTPVAITVGSGLLTALIFPALSCSAT